MRSEGARGQILWDLVDHNKDLRFSSAYDRNHQRLRAEERHNVQRIIPAAILRRDQGDGGGGESAGGEQE